MAAPNWSDNNVILAPQKLNAGSVARGAIDLRSANGAYLFTKIGKGGNTNLALPTNVQYRRMWSGSITHPNYQTFLGSVNAATGNSQMLTSYAGQSTVGLPSQAAVTTFNPGDIVCLQDGGGTTWSRVEFGRVASTSFSGTNVTLDAPLVYTHYGSNADTIRNHADVIPPIWMDGGSVVEVVIDNSQAGGGDPITIVANGQVWLS